LGELPKNKTIGVMCAVGLRGYLASRILMENGFRVKNLDGGYRLYSYAKGGKL
jgi:rhodanese-related sulfurtransferase